MEADWDGGPTRSISGSNPPTLGHPDFLSDEPSVSIVLSPGELPPTVPLPDGRALRGAHENETNPRRPLRWDHLIYAYMIENTRVYEIFRRVCTNIAMERSSALQSMRIRSIVARHEELFYSVCPFLITNVSSHIRSDLRANRRNAYQRMFGMELNTGQIPATLTLCKSRGRQFGICEDVRRIPTGSMGGHPECRQHKRHQVDR